MSESKVEEGRSVVDEPIEKDGKHPETVSWGQYVGIKESLGKKLDTAIQKVTNLEEQLKKAISAEEFNKTKQELDTVKAEHLKVSNELKTTKEKTLSELRASLIKKGVSEDEIKDASEKDLGILEKALGSYKPKPDMGGGGGAGGLKGTPMELAQRAYSEKK